MSFNKGIASSMLAVFMLFTTSIVKGDAAPLPSMGDVQSYLDVLQARLSDSIAEHRIERDQVDKNYESVDTDMLLELLPDDNKQVAINAIKQDRTAAIDRHNRDQEAAKKRKEQPDQKKQTEPDTKAIQVDKNYEALATDVLLELLPDDNMQVAINTMKQDRARIIDQQNSVQEAAKKKKEQSDQEKQTEPDTKAIQVDEEPAEIADDPKELDSGQDSGDIIEKTQAQVQVQQVEANDDIEEDNRADIEDETEKELANTENDVEYAKAVSLLSGYDPADDITPRFKVTQLKIGGNDLIATDKLLANLPLIYPTSEKARDSDDSVNVYYDFRVLHDIISDPGVERQVSQKIIQSLTKHLLSVYEKERYAGIFVYVPKETVKADGSGLKNDILSIRVLEGKVSDIIVNKYDVDQNEVQEGYLKKSSVLSWSPVKVGQVANKKQIDDYVRLLNQNRDRHAQAMISKGSEPGTLSLSYDIYEVNPWHMYFQIDNSGVDAKHQWSPRLGGINTNLTGNDDVFSFMYQAKPSSMDFIKDNYAVFGSYERPLFDPALRLGVFAGYSSFDLTPGSGTGMSFRGNGSFYGGSLRYNFFQVDEGPLDDWMFDFIGTLSHEESRMTPTLFQAFPEQEVRMNLLGIGVEAHHSDYAGMSETYLSFIKTSSLSGGSSEEEYQLARIGTDSDFTFYTFSASHKQFLEESKVHEFMGTFRYVASDKRLPSAKLTTFGGMYSVRGYEENEVVADGGVLASIQYRFDLSKYLINQTTSDKQEQDALYRKKEMWPPNLSMLVFSDYGRAETKDTVAGEVANETLMSLGVGVQAKLGTSLSAGVYYAVPLEDSIVTHSGDAGAWYFDFVYSW